jgi:hypothetical protein
MISRDFGGPPWHTQRELTGVLLGVIFLLTLVLGGQCDVFYAGSVAAPK